jgi:hypothetical protein
MVIVRIKDIVQKYKNGPKNTWIRTYKHSSTIV